MDGSHDQDPPSTSQYNARSIRREFESEPGSIPVGAIVETRTHGAWPAAVEPLFYFCQLLPRVILLLFRWYRPAIDNENYFQIQMVMVLGRLPARGTQDENTNRKQ